MDKIKSYKDEDSFEDFKKTLSKYIDFDAKISVFDWIKIALLFVLIIIMLYYSFHSCGQVLDCSMCPNCKSVISW